MSPTTDPILYNVQYNAGWLAGTASSTPPALMRHESDAFLAGYSAGWHNCHRPDGHVRRSVVSLAEFPWQHTVAGPCDRSAS